MSNLLKKGSLRLVCGLALFGLTSFGLTGAAAYARTPEAADATLSKLSAARDRQDLSSLDQEIADLRSAADSKPSPVAQYRLALAYSYAAEVAMQLHDKKRSANYAETGLDAARKAAESDATKAEYHRLYGEMCGQVIPANPLLGALKYGQCARAEVQKALQLNSGFALAYVSQGVGNYYLPSSMGGGPDLALRDFDKALALDPKLADAYLWKGITLKKQNRNAEARQALQQALTIDPGRMWAKQELDKTPPR